MKAPRLLNVLLPVVAVIALTLMAASCAPQKQYGCPNHLKSGVVE